MGKGTVGKPRVTEFQLGCEKCIESHQVQYAFALFSHFADHRFFAFARLCLKSVKFKSQTFLEEQGKIFLWNCCKTPANGSLGIVARDRTSLKVT